MSAPISEREAVLRERAAHASARCSAFAAALPRAGHSLFGDPPCAECVATAVKRFPLEMVTRPRVEYDIAALTTQEQWCVIDGTLRYRHKPDAEWMRWAQFRDCSTAAPLPERVRQWADLFANPTETVEVDE